MSTQHAVSEHKHEGHSHDGIKYWPIAISGAILLVSILLDYYKAPFFKGYVRIACYLVAYLFVGWAIIWKALRGIPKGRVFNEFFLMSLATIGAFALGEYAEAVAVMLFYTVGEAFNDAAVNRAKRNISALLDARPQTATVMREGKAVEVKPEKVAIGETLSIKPGERLALDGELLSENAILDTAALTGESVPVTEEKGKELLAGMVNLQHAIEIRTTKAFHDSALSHILSMVQGSLMRKAQTEKFITRFAAIYTPIVVVLAILLVLLPWFFVEGYRFQDWLYRALVFLVISCPCGLVVSVPLGYFGGIGAASRNGILFKGSNFLDLITKVNAVVMDKTGTLTKGVFLVQEVNAIGISKEEMIKLAAVLESKSSHPIALAVAKYAGETANIPSPEEVEEIAGHGLKGKVEGKTILAGNYKLLKKFAISYPVELEAITETIVAIAIDGRYAGYITVADEIKEDAAIAVKALHDLGIKEVVMLSGDKKPVVEKVARKLGIDAYFGELLPEDKVAKVEELKAKGRIVAFVGDGLNDAPVLALADIGMAMGGLGSDLAVETADVVIQTDQPSKIATAIRIGKATRRIVWQNIGFAFAVKVIVLVLGAGGLATLWEAIFADVGVAVLAILNAVRIQRMKF